VRITLSREDDGIPSFHAELPNFAQHRLPITARVYVEAYHRTSWMRFPFGTVAEVRPPENRRLGDLDSSAPLFRLKVVDESGDCGKVLADADQISPLDNDVPANRIPLLPVVLTDLGQAVWRLDFTNERPVLELNQSIDGIALLARSDDRFFSLVYPAVVQRILEQILLLDRIFDTDGPAEDSRCQWLRFATRLPGVGRPPEPIDDAEELTPEFQLRASEWIESAVAAFCRHVRAAERFAQATSGGGN
jgi:hypothetical protein